MKKWNCERKQVRLKVISALNALLFPNLQQEKPAIKTPVNLRPPISIVIRQVRIRIANPAKVEQILIPERE